MKALLFKYYVICSFGLGFMILNFPSPLLQMVDESNKINTRNHE